MVLSNDRNFFSNSSQYHPTSAPRCPDYFRYIFQESTLDGLDKNHIDSESDPDFKNGAVVVDEPKKSVRRSREAKGLTKSKRRSDVLENISSARSRTRSKVTKNSEIGHGGTYERIPNLPILT